MHEHGHASVTTWETLGAVGLLLWMIAMWTAVAVLAYAGRRVVRPWLYYGAGGVVLIGLLGQLGHVQEHFAQVAYWVAHPNDKAWMTPLGTGLANGFGGMVGGDPVLGMEILHLTGNFIFLAGLFGVLLVTRRALSAKARKWGRMGAIMQTIHGIEHLVLTVSVAAGVPAIGMSTWFGLLEPGPGLWTYRVWWHFVANVVGTVIFMVAFYHLCRERRQIASTFLPTVPGPRAPGASGRVDEPVPAGRS